MVGSGPAPKLTLALPRFTDRVLGPVSDGDQTELALEITYSLIGEDLVVLIPETKVRTTLIYVDSGANTSAEDQRVAELKHDLENDLIGQIVPSIRVRFEQALMQKDPPKAE